MADAKKRGPHKACFVGRGKAKAQMEFSACGKRNVVACALTKRVAAVDRCQGAPSTQADVGHRNRNCTPNRGSCYNNTKVR